MAAISIPEVDPVDLERVYETRRELLARHPNHVIGTEFLAQHCKPGANIEALCQRASLLTIFATAPDEIRTRLVPWSKHEGAWDAAAFRVAARFPMDWYQRGMFCNEELEEFLKLLKTEGEN
jgi:hypothetical protein